MYSTPKEPSKEERIERIKELLKLLGKDYLKAKSYHKKLTIKQDIAVLMRELKTLMGVK